jgi:hypothetical protein
MDRGERNILRRRERERRGNGLRRGERGEGK